MCVYESVLVSECVVYAQSKIYRVSERERERERKREAERERRRREGGEGRGYASRSRVEWVTSSSCTTASV